MFERPASAFIARFIGGHNVLLTGRGLIAVRADRCRIAAVAGAAPFVSGRVAAVEYQGAMVRVALAIEDGEEVSALLPDSDFYAKPVEPGEALTLTWSERDVHMLA